MLPAALESHTRLDTPFTLPACTIEDQPRYPWRGMHLDVSRHFFTKAEVERYIDLLSQYKMNVFHWHLTDDQGWRIEIKKYPLLTSKSAWRPYGPTEAGIPAPATQPDGSPGLYGGFYTQDDIREVVAFAKARFINVVPEIEMPGHALAALSAYPEFSCTGGPFTVGAPWGVFKEVYCPGKEATFTFIENVLDEVCDLFPGPYIHIGGDECPKDRWKTCPDCQARMKAEGLKNEDELQSYFVKRIEKFLETRHHRLIGWNEILQGGLAPGATVTSWQGMSGGRFAASNGHDVIMCPESNCYFDHTQDIGSNTHSPSSFLFESPVTLPKVYSFEPTPPDLTPEQSRHILGAQGNVWSERIPTQDRLDYMAFPRAIALAECLWTHGTDYPDFARRLTDNFQRLDAENVHYFHDPLAHATLVATWSAKDNLPATNKDIDFPLATPPATPGKYTVRFEFLGGKGHVDIDNVALLENGKELAHDTHPGSAGQEAMANGYLLTLDHTPLDGDSYAIRVALRSEEGPNTRGEIFLYPTPSSP
jgi:hexosaminidase